MVICNVCKVNFGPNFLLYLHSTNPAQPTLCEHLGDTYTSIDKVGFLGLLKPNHEKNRPFIYFTVTYFWLF